MGERYVAGAPQFDDHWGDGAPEPDNSLRRLVIAVAIIGVVGIVILVVWVSSTYEFKRPHDTANERPAGVDQARTAFRWVTATALNVRARPSADAKVNAQLSLGDRVEMTTRDGMPFLYEDVPEEWTHVRLNNGGGWVSSRYLSAERPDLFAQYRSGDRVIIPSGGLSRFPRYPARENVYVRMLNGQLPGRPRDLEDLLLDWYFFRVEALKAHAQGDEGGLKKYQRLFQATNRDINMYAESDISATNAYLVSTGQVEE